LRGKGAWRPRRFTRFNDLTISIDLTRHLLAISDIMRLLAEILIIGALISVGWRTPFKEYADRAKTTIDMNLHRVGHTMQKNQDESVRRY
jgi:hypothetical protein